MPRHRSISRSGICGSGKHIGRAHRDGAIGQIVTMEIFKPKDGIGMLDISAKKISRGLPRRMTGGV
jgi:hypothetical protein